MTEEITVNHTREDFVKWMANQLSDLGFEKDPEMELWFNEQDIQEPTRTIVINGQRNDVPGESHHIRFEVDIFGNGEMKDVGTEVVKPFIEVNFNVFQDDHDVTDWPTFCIFFDDQLLFNSLLNKIFRL